MLVILRSLHAQQEMLQQIRLAFAWLMPLGVLLAGCGGYFLARRSLAPVAAMGKQAQRIIVECDQKEIDKNATIQNARFFRCEKASVLVYGRKCVSLYIRHREYHELRRCAPRH